MLWDKEKQCWHDKMANDVVVPVDGVSGGALAVTAYATSAQSP